MKERKNVTWEYRKLNTKDMMVDELYQRDIDPKRLMRMVKDYDPCLVNAVKVSYRDGKYWIYDGRHTAAMLRSVVGKGKDTEVECKVFTGLTRLDEMELFVAQNGASAPVSVNAKLRALYNFGDKDVRGMVEAAAKAGVLVDFTKGQGLNKCVAASTLIKTYLSMEREQFIDMLTTIRLTWNGIADSFSREMLVGMAAFYRTYYGRFKQKDFVKSLSRVLPIQIIREGKSYNASWNTATAYARVILRLYNFNRTKNRLGDEL